MWRWHTNLVVSFASDLLRMGLHPSDAMVGFSKAGGGLSAPAMAELVLEILMSLVELHSMHRAASHRQTETTDRQVVTLH